jgi:hypothetical protein
LLLVAVFIFTTSLASAHDLERTRVALTFSPDGAFVLDVANDPDWLTLRIERFAPADPAGPVLQNLGPVFIDRVVLWVDGREIRPTSVEYIAPPPALPGDLPNLGIYRMRGRMPIDLSGQFRVPLLTKLNGTIASILIVVALLIVPLAIRLRSSLG